MLAILVVFAVLSFAVVPLARFLGSRVFYLAALLPIAGFVHALMQAPAVVAGHIPREAYESMHPRRRDLDADGRTQLGADPGRHRGRRDRADLLRHLFPRPGSGQRAVRRRAARLRRNDVRSGAHRRHHHARHLLGDHEHPVVSAHRPLLQSCRQPPRGTAVTADDHARRAGDVRRRSDPRRAGRLELDQRDSERPAVRVADEHRPGLPADRRVQQVGDLPVPLLASWRDGRAYARERVSARCGDGQGGHLPARALCADLRGGGAVAPAGGVARRVHDAARGLPGAPRGRPQATSRLRHGEPARIHHGRDRLRHA